MPAIITFAPDFRKQALQEAWAAESTVQVERELSPAEALLGFAPGNGEFQAVLRAADPVFIKHVMPVDIQSEITGLEDITRLVTGHFTIPTGASFTVQCRIVDNGFDFSAKDVEVAVGSYYDGQGAAPVFSDYGLLNVEITVLSIYIQNAHLYAGLSASGDNLNFHANEYRVLSREGRRISRAENKLKEAIVKFGLDIGTENGLALDIGAAPGGWTAVLVDHGYRVAAVDPGDLHSSLYQEPRVTHYKCKAQEAQFTEPFDLIVNDMNMDPQQSAAIMNEIAHLLKPGGLAVMTIKIPFSDVHRCIDETKEILQDKYELLHLKHLFHNRREVTAVLRRK